MKRILILALSAILLLSACSTLTASPTAAPTIAQTATVAPTAAPTATPTEEPTASPTAEPTATPTTEPTASPTAAVKLSLTSGLPSDKEYRPVNVQIENRPEARPQSGMSQADIVYEALVEGRSMTRFQCVFNDNQPTNVGPVRSCRLYYVDIASEYKGVLAFFGGPSGGPASIFPKISKATGSGLIQVAANGISGKYGTKTKLYWRITARKAPHNVYTNIVKLAALIKTPAADAVSHFQFDANATLNGNAVNNIEIVYNRNTVDTRYVYDPALGKYKRFIGNDPMIDALNNQQITVTNVIIQYAKTYSLNTSKGHINIVLIGSGKAEVFFGGKHIKATWKRPTLKDITRYYDASGNEITLLPGNTWVQEVPSDGGVPVKLS